MPKFGNYLFRNLKETPPTGTPTPAPAEPAPLDDRELLLTEADFASEEALVPALAWEQWPEREVRLRFGDTRGLTTGRVTVTAGVLRQSAPGLVPPGVPDDLELPLSLKTVVLQLQPYLPAVTGNLPRSATPDFDTPIAQVAREDEGFFKLEQSRSADVAEGLPLIRERPRDAGEERPPAADPTLPPALPVRVPRPQPLREPRAGEGGNAPFDPFADLPAVGPRPATVPPAPSPAAPSQMPAVPPRDPGHQTSAPAGSMPDEPLPAAPSVARLPSSPAMSLPASVATPSGAAPGAGAGATFPSSKRRALERLQEIFMTDDYLDLDGVLRCLRAFPRVRTVFVIGADGARHGDDPVGSGAFSGEVVLQTLGAAAQLAEMTGNAGFRGFTLLGQGPLSVVGDRRLALVLQHEGRTLPPGMQERLVVVADALADLLT